MAKTAPLVRIADDLSHALRSVRIGEPVAHVYRPLEYARAVFAAYAERFGAGPKRVVFVGMNPGPFGMMQTGIPFGEVAAVRDWMQLSGEVERPPGTHPKRPVLGFETTRSEVSGARLWGLFAKRFGKPEAFFRHGFVLNYCPLGFLDAAGRNVTPDSLPRTVRDEIEAACDVALASSIRALEPDWVVGVGKYAEARVRGAVPDASVAVIAHPSPASPAANRGWEKLAEDALRASGVPWPT